MGYTGGLVTGLRIDFFLMHRKNDHTSASLSDRVVYFP